jgi:hypothetical protein
MSVEGNGNNIQTIRYIPVDQLLLDKENPRLASGNGGDSQVDLVRVLWTEMSVDEVALSIAANGFFPEETLFAIPEEAKGKFTLKKKYVVVEGNRRLAAVMLLRDDELRKKLKATDLPKISTKAKAKLDSLPVSVYNNREELWAYFGFRHINGPKPWDAFSKAKYVAGVKNNFKIPLDEIARRIGDRHSTVQKLYRGYEILLQAEKAAGFNREDRIKNKFYFSHLYTAVDQGEYQKFLGITSSGSLKPNPIPSPKLGELRELMIWIYGSQRDNKQPVVQSQNPDLNILREVIGDRRALSALRGGISLYRSYEIARGDEQRFQEALTKAKENLTEASGTEVLGYKGDEDAFMLVKEINSVATELHSSMERKRVKSK